MLGALDQGMTPATWEGTDEERVLALNRVMLLKDIIGMADVAVLSEVLAPFWEDDDGDDAEIQLPPDEQPWYEELSHWIVAGFLAVTFTPAAAVFYISTIKPARIAFRGRRYGAVVEILLDGILHDTVDTYSETDSVIEYALDIPVPEEFMAFVGDPVEVQIRHSGDENPDATPTEDGFAIEIIRDYFGRDKNGAPVTKYDPDEDEVLTSVDGGLTYIPTPEADPRNIINFPPLTGGNANCRGAQAIVNQMQIWLESLLDFMEAGAGIAAAATAATAFLRPFMWFGLLATIATSTVAAIFGAGVNSVRDAFTAGVWDDLRCIFQTLLDSQGRMPAENMSRLHMAIGEQLDGTASVISSLIVALTGHGGLSNWAAQDTETYDCDTCCLDYTDLMVGELGWRSHISEYSAIQLDGNDGIYENSGGHNAGGGRVRGFNQPNNTKILAFMIDMGTECFIEQFSFWAMRTIQSGNINRQIRVFNSSFVQTYAENTNVNSGANVWAQYNRFIGLATGRYVAVYLDVSAASGQLYLSDILVNGEPPP